MEDVRSQLLNAAGPIFAEKGYKATTVREICGSAGVNVAAVNYYFGDKERLYIEAVKRASHLRAEEVPIPSRPAGTTPDVRLTDFIKTLLTRMLGDDREPWQSRLMTREVLQPTQACRELVEHYFRPHFEMLQAILSELVPVDTPRSRLRKLGFTVVGQCLFYRVAGEVVSMLTPPDELRDEFTTDQLAEHISSVTLRAVSACESGQSSELGFAGKTNQN